MALAIDQSASTDGGVTTSSVTLSSLTIGAGANLLICEVSVQDATKTVPDTVTWNGVAMTKYVTGTTNASQTMSHWYLVSPAVGNYNLVASVSSGTVGRWSIGAVSFSGADTSTPLGNTATTTGNSTTPSVATTTAYTNSLVFNSVMINDVHVVTVTGTNQTERFNQNVNSNHRVAGSTQTTTSTGSYTSSWSFTPATQWSMLSTEIVAAQNFTITASVGAFALAGQSVSFGQAVVAAVGAFVVAIQEVVVRFSGWTTGTKNSSTFTTQSKNGSSWNNQNKN